MLQIGCGLMAVVLKGELNGLECALKMFKDDEEAKKSMKVEVDILSKLNHPNIVRMLDQKQNIIFLELLECSLWDLVLKKIEKRMFFLYGLDIFSGLEYIHQMNLIHRDIKPHNILVGSRLKICDFGSCTSSPSSKMCGTTPYMAPEVFESKYTYSADVYSACVTMYVLLMNQEPYTESKALKLMIYAKQGFLKHHSKHESLKLVNDGLNLDPEIRPSAREIKEWFFNHAQSNTLQI